MNHSGAFTAATYRINDATVRFYRNGGLFGHSVGGHDRSGKVWPAVITQMNSRHGGPDLIHRDQDSGDAGGTNAELLRRRTAFLGAESCHFLCFNDAGVAEGCVSVAGVG